jgi:tripartite-type tricarboxylate transporter receptor subunit TctC
LNQPDVKEKFLAAGIEPLPSSPAELAALRKSDMARMGKVIKDAGITPQ